MPLRLREEHEGARRGDRALDGAAVDDARDLARGHGRHEAPAVRKLADAGDEASPLKEGEGEVGAVLIRYPAAPEREAVELPAEDLKALSEELSKTFASEIAAGLEFRPSQSVQAGFRISEKDGSGYIDVSAEKCQELLFPYLSDSLKSIL